jgi:hypothetical protein
MKTETWRELRSRLIEAGVTDSEIIESVRRATAPDRIAARREMAMAVARNWVTANAELAEGSTPSEETIDRRARALCWLEAQLSRLWPIPSKRLPPFQLVGSGRRHAADGAAWTESIESASRDHEGYGWRLFGLLLEFEGDGATCVPLEQLVFGFEADELRQVLLLLREQDREDLESEAIVVLAAAVQRGLERWQKLGVEAANDE